MTVDEKLRKDADELANKIFASGVELDAGLLSNALELFALDTLRQVSDAVRWALGEHVDDNDFAPRPDGAGPYWWRTELRRRAGLDFPSPPTAGDALAEGRETAERNER